jgi:hypothetical protein
MDKCEHRMARYRIVVGNRSIASYMEGGGHWMVRLQLLLGLKALDQDVFLLELLWSTGNPSLDQHRITSFFQTLEYYDLNQQAALLLFPKDCPEQNLAYATAFGRSLGEVGHLITHTDFLWNDCCHIRQPLLGMFRNRVLMDLDPGHLQVSALTVNMNLYDHQTFLSVGKKLHDADCEVPTLGLKWHTFLPFIYLPMWKADFDPGPEAPFTSITQWTWAELWWKERVLSISKRDAYLRHLHLPQKVNAPFELAVNLHPEDRTGDKELLQSHGWHLVDPHKVAGSPAAYQTYLQRSRAEFLCPKPIFRELNTGWFSDRSACYLASGRPVLAEDTGFSEFLPSGNGLLAFHTFEEAIEGVQEIQTDYPLHRQRARELAEEYLDSRRTLHAMLAACL